MKIKQYDVKREAAKISALQWGKIDQYEYLAGEEIVLFDQSRIAEQARLLIVLFEKAFEKQAKIIEDQCRKQRKEIEEHVKSKPKHEIYWTQMIKNQEIKILMS